MKTSEISIGARVVYAPPGPHRQRAGIVTGLAQSGRRLRVQIRLDNGTEALCPLNFIQPLHSTPPRSCVRCSVCKRVCGEEWHGSYATAAREADASGWTQSAGLWVCPECQ